MLIPLFEQTIEPLPIVIKEEQPPSPVEKLYTIKENDTLTSISESTGSSVERLWDKNLELTDPDIIEPGKTLKVPPADEALQDRPMPVKVVIATPSPQATSGGSFISKGTSGNTYSYGYCTWYVKNMRPDLPNNLGNADTWYVRYNGNKGTVPQVGAVAVAVGYMHVAIVTAVHGDSITIREMNYNGWNVVSSRTAPASEFRYIY